MKICMFYSQKNIIVSKNVIVLHGGGYNGLNENNNDKKKKIKIKNTSPKCFFPSKANKIAG